MGLAVQEAADLARSSLEREVLVALPAEPQEVLTAFADPDRLRQVLLDLIENAHKYSPNGTAISVRLSATHGMAVVDVETRGSASPQTT